MVSSRVRSRRFLRALSAGVVAAAALASAPATTAHADGTDDQFLNAVKSKDINFASPQAALQAGHQVCNELDQGKAKADVANDVQSSSNLDGYHAGFFVGLSVAAFCPQHHATN